MTLSLSLAFPFLVAFAGGDPPRDPLDRLASRDDVGAPRVVTGDVTAYWITSSGATPTERGTYRLLSDGGSRAALELSLPVIGTVAWSTGGDRVWEVDPLAGPIVHHDKRAAGVRRLLTAVCGGSGWDSCYESAVSVPRPASGLDPMTAATDGWSMTPSLGDADQWRVDRETGLLALAWVHSPSGDGRTSKVRVELDEWTPDGDRTRPTEIRIEREHYRFVLREAEVQWTRPSADAFSMDEQLRDAATNDEEVTGDAEMKITRLQTVHVASIRKKMKMAELSREFATLLPEVMSYVRAHDVEPAGAPFARYHAFGPTEADVEVGFPLTAPIEGDQRVKASTLPGGRALTTWHVGPYHELTRTYGRVEAWMKEQEISPREAGWEVYWTDPGLVPDPAKWRTQIVRPIE